MVIRQALITLVAVPILLSLSCAEHDLYNGLTSQEAQQKLVVAPWSPNSRQWQHEQNTMPSAWQDHFVVSVWGSVQAYRAQHTPNYIRSRLHLRSRDFAEGGLDVIAMRQTTEVSGVSLTRAAPLVFVFTGLGGQLDDSMPLRKAYYFASRGYHVVVFPSPFSPEFISQRPTSRAGDMPEEAKMLSAMMRGVRVWLGVTNVTNTELVGESYGGFLAAITFAKIAASEEPWIDRLTVVAPPLNLNKAVSNLDQVMHATRSYYRNHCSATISFYMMMRSYAGAWRQQDLSQHARRCASSLFAHGGFQKTVRTAAREIDEAYGLGLIPRGRAGEAYLKTLGVRTMLATFSPRAHDLLHQPDLPILYYWLKQAALAGNENFRIVMAQDDYLNQHVDAYDLAESYGVDFERHHLMLTRGGHLGFVAWRQYEQFLDRAFAPRLLSYRALYRYRDILVGLRERRR